MDESHERDDRLSPHPQAEGVRIIRAEEAQAALEAGQAAGRRPDDALRFGDVPPPPSGPRSPHRFPLPDSVDPASAVPRPAIKPPERRFTGRFSRNKPTEAPRSPSPPRVVRLLPADAESEPPDEVVGADFGAEHTVPRGAWEDAGLLDETLPRLSPTERLPVGVGSDAGRHFAKDPEASAGPGAMGTEGGGDHSAGRYPGEGRGGLDVGAIDRPDPPRPGAPYESYEPQDGPPDLSPPEEGINLQTGAIPDLPHWTDPPTGEVPFISSDREPSQGEELAAWQALGSRGLRWRDEASDWDDLDDVSDLADDDTRLGALDTTRTEHSDVYSFDEQFDRLEDERSGPAPIADPFLDAAPPVPPVRRASGRQSSSGPRPPRRTGRNGGGVPVRNGSGGGAGAGRDLQSATVVGVGMLLGLIIAYVLGAAVLMLLATVIVTAAALELYNLIQHRGFRPATLLGVSATVAVMLASYWRGEVAAPLILALVFITSMLWYMLQVVDARPVVNIGLTVMAFVWVGFLGSYASLLLQRPGGHGKQLLLLPVLVTVAADTAAYFAGSSIGSRPLAPSISPGKTWEGVIAGGIGAIIISVVLSRLPFLKGTWTFNHAFLLGLMIAVVAPIGDLCESMVKRDLDLKDSGSFLPGHGGLLDRFDALLFVLPATYYLVAYLRLV
ncbi:MAG TPA: CDP-archaeol synthase [Acidimicrobiales bacterium]|nr:CDP-archaeol synthase [Acidimicrobiales bacterium]